MRAAHPASWVGRPHIKGGREPIQMAFLTAASIGLAFCWGTEMTYCAPYLLSLGLSKSKLSLVWIAGPLSGLIMQPLIGMISDKSRSKYGRRRPFMVVGTLAVLVCFLVLGWTREVVRFFVTDDEETVRRLAVALAIVDIFVLDFMINIAQTACIALVVDTLPTDKQQLGAAWGSRMAGVGGMLLYAIGALDLDALLGDFLGDTHLKKVCLIAAIAMVVSQGTTCWAVSERVLIVDNRAPVESMGLFSILSQIYTATRNVPVRIQAICRVQFWSWIGWFPFLFYGSTWVGEIYLRYEAPPNTSSKDALTDVSRHGSMSFIVFSIVSFVASIVLPWLVRMPDENQGRDYTARPPSLMSPVLQDIKLRKPSLLTAWALSNMLFAVSMIFAPLVQSVWFATVLIALCAVPKAIAGWAPTTFLGVEVNSMSSAFPTARHSAEIGRRISDESIELDESMPKSLHLRHVSTASVSSSSTGELSGIYLGILNIYTTIPQFIGTGISWIVFSILEPGQSPELAPDAPASAVAATNVEKTNASPQQGMSGIGVCLFIGAICACMAAWSTKRLRAD